jgi:hypothetical protein
MSACPHYFLKDTVKLICVWSISCLPLCCLAELAEPFGPRDFTPELVLFGCACFFRKICCFFCC